MCQSISTAGRSEDRSMAGIMSLIVHIALLAILFFYRFPATPAPETETIVIDFGGGGDDAAAGQPDRGMNDSPAPQGEQMDNPSSNTPAPDPTPTPAPPTPSKPAPAPPVNNTPTTEDPNVAAVKRQQEEARKRQQVEAENQRRIEEQQRAAAAAEAARIQKEAADKAAKKGKFGDTFGKPGGTGTGAGGGGKPGNGGVPDGTGNNPFGHSAGGGGGGGGGQGGGQGPLIGGGLSNRKVSKKSIPVDNSQASGVVVVNICVDAEGNVTTANYSMRGSTTQDSNLKSKAIAAARAYKFVAGNDNECGTIAFNFQLK